jgi:N6-L-threonylcarbamoyladenine synthase
VLGIESSCDDTGAAVVSSNGTILGEALASQSAVHEPFGGVVPGLARDEHARAIDDVIATALRRAGLDSASQVDAIGVTVGPGLEICLRIGCAKAAELARLHGKPFVGVHHLEAHILMARLFVPSSDPPDAATMQQLPAGRRSIEFPFLSLLVSGGHCLLLKCLGIGRYEILGGTVDDSLGEAFDKVARLLGLPVGGGGGPRVEALAKCGDPSRFPFTVPLQARKKDVDFSYSGLKTNVRRLGEQIARERGVESMDRLPESDKADLAASFQRVAITHIEQRLERAMKMLEEDEDDGIRSLAVVGGVAANQELRRRLNALCESRGWTMVVPPPRLCTDQGAMSAWAAVERLLVGSSDDPTTQEVYARYPFAATSVQESQVTGEQGKA